MAYRAELLTASCWVYLLVLLGNVQHGTATSCSFPTQRVQCGRHSCNKTTNECVPCLFDSDCYQRALKCVPSTGNCEYKTLAESFNGLTILAPISGFLVCAIAVVAGAGGGAILVPAYFTFLGVPLSGGVALSQATICGQSGFNVFVLLRRRHPKHHGDDGHSSWPVINYEYVLLLLPFSLIGTLLGSLGDSVVPDWFRVVFLIFLNGIMLFRLTTKIMFERRKEAIERARRTFEDCEETYSNEPTSCEDKGCEPSVCDKTNKNLRDISDAVTPCELTPLHSDLSAVSYTESNRSEGNLDKSDVLDNKEQYPRVFLFLSFVLFIVQFGFSYLKKSAVKCGTWQFGIIIAASIVWNSSFSLGFRQYLSIQMKKIERGEARPSVVPFIWSFKTTVVFPMLSMMAGAAASLLGLGGGIVLSFLLLEAGLLPEVSSATGGFATFLIAFQSAIIFILKGTLRYDYGLMVFASGMLSTAIGQFVIMKEIRKRKMTSMIMVCLFIIMAGSVLALSAVGIYNTIEITKVHGDLGFGDLCKPSD
eukprot:Tbor_TRINITY_DN5682_c0_g1::TRINITY_DN5682_c0_g1_i4::g.8519::m.8519